MKKSVTNFAQSARDRLLMLAVRQNVQFEYVLLRYTFERFLYRLSISPYADRFVVKGASAFAVWVGPFCRVTRDADFEAFGDMTHETLLRAIGEICAIDYPEDGVVFDTTALTASDIKKGDKYPGVRITFRASIGGAHVPMQCDIACGDSVFPDAEIIEYPTLIGCETPRVRVYSRYTIVAEKFQIMVSRGLLNSRLKDYYDLWLLSEHFDFDRTLLRATIERTCARRNTVIPTVLPDALSPAFANDSARRVQWRAFLRKANVTALELDAVIGRLATFFKPILTISD